MFDYKKYPPDADVWKIIADELMRCGFEVYPPATKFGECRRPYIVLKRDGASKKNRLSTQVVYYKFFLYVPKNMYTELDSFEKSVKSVIDTNLYPLLMPSGQIDTDYYDDNFDAHLRTFLYTNNIRNKHV